MDLEEYYARYGLHPQLAAAAASSHVWKQQNAAAASSGLGGHSMADMTDLLAQASFLAAANQQQQQQAAAAQSQALKASSNINSATSTHSVAPSSSTSSSSSLSKYQQLLAVIEEMGKDIRPTYSGSKSSAERLKRGIVHARILYTLKENGNRTGAIELYSHHQTAPFLTRIWQSEVEDGGVLDCKWNKDINSPLLSVARSTGMVQIWAPDPSGDASMIQEHSLTIDSSSLVLSLDWFESTLACSLSNGHLSLIDVPSLSVTSSWKVSPFESWITLIDRFNSNLIYSGDDLGFQQFDLRLGTNKPSFKLKQDPGFPSMQCSPHSPFQLALGGYDGSLSLLDTRSLSKPLSCVQCGDGGIWRVKYHPTDKEVIGLAGMQGGAHVVRCADTDSVETKVLTDCQTLCYGFDWLSPSSFASCSFYDSQLNLISIVLNPT